VHSFFAKLLQHPNYYNIRYYRKGGRLRNENQYHF